MESLDTDPRSPERSRQAAERCSGAPRRACPVCGGSLLEIRHKLHCERCHAIVETCCEGGRG